MPMTKADAEDITRRFLRDYPGALALAYRFRADVATLYPGRASEVPDNMKGGYISKETYHRGRVYQGRVDVPLQNMADTRDLLLTLRHEVLGHYGINTFQPAEKRALLDGLIAAREESSLTSVWTNIDRRYAGQPLDVRAEEVFALQCEFTAPSRHNGNGLVQQHGRQSFLETVIARIRPMTADDLKNIAYMVADGLHDRTRTQQTFPEINELFRKGSTMDAKKPFSQVVAEKLIEQLKAGTAPWQQPWQPGEPNSLMPMNPTTGKRYKGINAIHLMSYGHSDGRWMTYKQAAGVGAQVRKGEKGTPVQYWKFSEEQDKLDNQGRPVRDASGEPVKESVQLERPRVFFATVFNAEQIDGLPQPQQIKPKAEQQWDAVERAEHILQASGAQINHRAGNKAFYRPSNDSITLPEKVQFESADRYYATALHELGHWTGHPSRLDRDLAHPFGSEGYAKEELRAEISSMIVGDELGIGHDPGQHAAYVGYWIKTLQDDPLELFRAASDAEKIHDYVLAFEHELVHEQQADLRPPHEMTLAEFAGQVTVEKLENHGRRWEVILGDRDRAFSDAESPDAAIADAHRGAVNNALYLNTPGAAEVDPKPTLPPTAVLAEYPDLVKKFPDAVAPSVAERTANQYEAMQEANMQTSPEPMQPDEQRQIEATTLEHVASGTLGRLLPESASLEQIDKTLELLNSMQPMNTNNAFWTRHELPFDTDPLERKINAAMDDLIENRRPDAVVAAAFLDLESAKVEKPERQYINVPFAEKSEAKQRGARWDRQQQTWFIPRGVDATPFAKWARDATTAAVEAPPNQQAPEVQGDGQKAAQQARQYLAVPYEQRTAAKAGGALWDKTAKSWYAGPRADMATLEQWKPENVQAQQGPAMTPREEFAEAMRSAGLFTGSNAQGGHPIMDGTRHRVPVEGGKKGALDGFYVGHLDGHPAGRIINNKTGTDITWKSKGYALSAEEKATLHAEAATKLAARSAEVEQQQDATAQRIGRQMDGLTAIAQPTPYLAGKGIRPHAGALTDKDGQETYIPAFDTDGKQWTMQYIQEDGTKRFAKDSRKDGCFHPVGGMEALAAAPVLVVSEGYATAASNAEALGFATVAAFDAGNLHAVATALRVRYPDKPILIAGDDDKALAMTHGVNPGRTKAEAAAEAVGGLAVFPVFAPNEINYPAALAPVTPAKFKAGELTESQLAAIDRMKRYTDFNDLAQKSEFGREGLARQLRAAVGQAHVHHRQQKHEQMQEHVDVATQAVNPRRHATRVG